MGATDDRHVLSLLLVVVRVSFFSWLTMDVSLLWIHTYVYYCIFADDDDAAHDELDLLVPSVFSSFALRIRKLVENHHHVCMYVYSGIHYYVFAYKLLLIQ